MRETQAQLETANGKYAKLLEVIAAPVLNDFRIPETLRGKVLDKLDLAELVAEDGDATELRAALEAMHAERPDLVAGDGRPGLTPEQIKIMGEFGSQGVPRANPGPKGFGEAMRG